MKPSDASPEIRVAVFGEWVPPQLANVLAQQRAEEPETTAELIGLTAASELDEAPAGRFDIALSPTGRRWPGWACEPLWHDTLAVAIAKRSHLLAYPEVPSQEVLKQPLIHVQSTIDEPWHSITRRLFGADLQVHELATASFEIAMTLVSAGYGIAIAPAGQLAGHLYRGIAMRPLAGAPDIVTTYLLFPNTDLPDSQFRLIQRARSLK